METEKLIKSFYDLMSKISAYDHALAILNYDGATTAPAGTAANRGHAMAVLGEEIYKLSTSDSTYELLEELDRRSAELSPRDVRAKDIMLKDMRDTKKIPMDEYIAFQVLCNEADDVWHKAKAGNDFELFAPYLEKIVKAKIAFAGYIDPDKDPYDFWLNEYEEGISRKTCDAFFDSLREQIVPLIAKVTEAGQVSDAPLKGHFPADAQMAFSVYLMDLIGLDREHVGISTTEHPFTTSLGSHLDERITTHFYEERLDYSMFSVIHEGGHALYDTGSDDDLAYTVLDGGVSMGIHESQSRFYENILGRSRGFIQYIYPKMCEFFPSLKAYSVEDVYKAVNRVEPSLIRTEADEVTYCLHIMVRYELEKKLMSGQMQVRELPKAWNALYKEYLGIDVPDDTHGVLQDTHWSGGMIGYFPSYALGSAYGAQFLARMKETVDVDACLARGDFKPINAWNRENIWKFGCLKKPGQILSDVLGRDFDPSYYIDYLKSKISDVYGIRL
ncbi:MAG: carboxypeptidase M32 [Clostridia bacterium]|nr:carboxypeptidase M32 [Clostridia bacterium]